MNGRNAATALLAVTHLRSQVHQEEQLPVALARQPKPKASVEAKPFVFVANLALDLRPINAERRVRNPVVEALALVAVDGEAVAEDDVARVLALDEHVRETDRIRL